MFEPRPEIKIAPLIFFASSHRAQASRSSPALKFCARASRQGFALACGEFNFVEKRSEVDEFEFDSEFESDSVPV